MERDNRMGNGGITIIRERKKPEVYASGFFVINFFMVTYQKSL